MNIVITSCNSLVGRNNWSRKEFKKYRLANGYKQEGHQNAFIRDGKVYAFSTPAGYKAECRQFAEHYSGLVCLMPNGEYKEFSRDQLVLSSITRKGPGGIKYFQADEKAAVPSPKKSNTDSLSPKIQEGELFSRWCSSESRMNDISYVDWLCSIIEAMSCHVSKKEVNWLTEEHFKG